MDNTIFAQLKSHLTSCESYATQYNLGSEYQHVLNHIENAMSDHLNVLICGEFKRGKSSFINSLIGQDICPVDDGITTSAISVIHYGECPKVTRLYGNITDESVSLKEEEIALDSINSFAVGDTASIDGTIMLDIAIPNENLKSGLTFIDTPGVGSLDPRHLFLTLYALPKADVIFFITDAGEPLTTSERDFFSRRILPLHIPTRLIINKADLITQEQMKTLVSDTARKFNEIGVHDLSIIPVSSTKWSKYNRSADERAKEQSNCMAVLLSIKESLVESRNCKVDFIRQEILTLLNTLKEEVLSAISLLQESDYVAVKQRLIKEQHDIQTLRNDLINENSQLRQKISSLLRASQKEVLNEFTQESILLSSEKLDEIMSDKTLADDGGEEKLVSKVREEICKLSSDIDAKIGAAFEKILSNLSQELNLPDQGFDPNMHGGIRSVEHSISEVAVSLVRQALPTATVFTAAGSVSYVILGAITPIATLALPVGLIVGVGAAASFFLFSVLNGKRQEKLANMRRQIAPKIQLASNELRQYILDKYELFQESLVSSLSHAAEQQSERMLAITQLLKEAEENEQSRVRKIKELEQQNTFFDGVSQKVKVFGTNPFVKK